MRYLLAIVVFLAGAILPCPVQAQSFHPVLIPQGVDSYRAGGSGFHPFLRQSQMVVFPPFWGYPANYPFQYFYPGLWPPIDVEYQEASRIAHGNVAAEVAAQQKDLLSSQVQALTEELHSLRERPIPLQSVQAPSASLEAEKPAQASQRAETRLPQKFPVTVFIYRDGREMEARDYAIFGRTLWVFGSDTSHKFPLSDFNLDASRQVNEEHGVEFPLPRHSSE